MSNDISFLNDLSQELVTIEFDASRRQELIQVLIDKVEHKYHIKHENVNMFITGDVDIFVKCFNIVNTLPSSKFHYRTWKNFKSDDDSDDESFQIQCISVENYRSGAKQPYTICEITPTSVIFDTWRLKCAMYT